MTDIEIFRVASKISPESAAFMAAWDAAKESAVGTIAALTAQRDRALEAVEKLKGKGSELRLHIDYDRWPNECDSWDAALAATEPATVELPKCDHCGASCGTDCDGSSHYTPDGKR